MGAGRDSKTAQVVEEISEYCGLKLCCCKYLLQAYCGSQMEGGHKNDIAPHNLYGTSVLGTLDGQMVAQ